MNKFYESVAQVLEVDEVGFDTDFRQVPGWSSLQVSRAAWAAEW